MKKFRVNKKGILLTLLLIILISNFSVGYSYWDQLIDDEQVGLTIGDWNFDDTETEVAEYLSNHEAVLALTVESVSESDQAAVEQALEDYGLLSEAAKAELSTEETLLISLFNEIIALEHSEFIDFEGYAYDSGLTGTIEINGRTWYGNDVFISNDDDYDVWNDTRSLALRSTAYFESQDLFINGIDKVTIYFGALNYNNGASFQFKVEYELESNPGVWVTLQENGSDLLVDVTSATPLGYAEIDVFISEAMNIRFTPVISTTSDYINLDDIRIYEHVVSSDLEVTTFETIYKGALALTVETVEISDQSSVEQALAAYELLSEAAKAALTTEKALLDSLLEKINLEIEVEAAEAFVVIAEASNQQADVDAAQVKVTNLPNGTDKTALQARLDAVQDTIDEIASFLVDYSDVLALTIQSVEMSDQASVEQALAAYELLSESAKASLSTEKTLLDQLLTEINNQIPTETQVSEFRNDYADVLALTVQTVAISDQENIDLALSIYETLSEAAKAALTTEKALLDSLLEEIIVLELIEEAEAYVVIAEASNQQTDVDAAQVKVTNLPNRTEKTALQARLDAVQDRIDTAIAVAEYLSNHEAVLALTVETVSESDQAAVEQALEDYGLLSEAAKAELSTEETLLISLFNEIIALEHSEFIDFEGYAYDSGLTGTIEINGRTWYGNDVFISNDDDYDVWNDTRSLALRSTAYFESQDLFINGIDKVTIYFGALNYDNGASFQFKVEYELESNPGVWVTLQENGSDLLVDVTSATPLGYAEIDVFISEAMNIRFTPVISTTSDYINLDDIRIYEHVVSSDLEVTTFETIYKGALALTVETVEMSNQSSVEQALAAYELLSEAAKAALTTEKALLDSLLEKINLEIEVEAAEAFVVIAEASNQQADVDAAQVKVTNLPNGTDKTALQARLDAVQDTIDEIASFLVDYSDVLALTIQSVEMSDQASVEQALAGYELLSESAKASLSTEKTLLDQLLTEINNQIPTETQVSEFRSDYADVLALTVQTVAISDQENIDLALSIYETLSEAAKAELTTETALLDSLLEEIIVLELIEEAEAFVVIAEASNQHTDVDAAQVKVTNLPDRTEKTALQARLDAVKDWIDVQTASQLITNYFDSNSVVVSRLNNNSLKEEAFLLALDDVVDGLDVTITITNTNRIDRRNTTYTIVIVKNDVSETMDVAVSFTR